MTYGQKNLEGMNLCWDRWACQGGVVQNRCRNEEKAGRVAPNRWVRPICERSTRPWRKRGLKGEALKLSSGTIPVSSVSP